MDQKQFILAIDQICEEKGISKEKVLETIEAAIAAAYKKDYGQKGQNLQAKLDPVTGESKIFQIKEVVDESMILTEKEIEELKAKKTKQVREESTEAKSAEAEHRREEEERPKKIRFNPERHIMLDEALKIKSGAKVGDEISFAQESAEEYGRIAAQTAKQVIIQKIREAEREAIFEEYKGKVGQIVGGIIQRIERGFVFIDIGKTTGILPPEEQIPQEKYLIGKRLKIIILKMESGSKGPQVFVSRVHPEMIRKLFEVEVPEISAGAVEIKAIAREAGSRSKIAVVSKEEGVDPVGSCVGQKGMRVQTVINELGGEKIDIIPYEEDQKKFIARALSPAKISRVIIKNKTKNIALVEAPSDQLSLAIGKRGQNVRLAAKLTGWKINIIEEKKLEPEAKSSDLSAETKVKAETKHKLEKKKPKKVETKKGKEKKEKKKKSKAKKEKK